MHLSIHQFIYLSILHLDICISIHLSIRQSIYPFIHQFISSIYLSIYLSIYPSSIHSVIHVILCYNYFLQACAPLWEFVALDNDILSSQPRGRCVYSSRTLTNFSILFPCDGKNI